MPSDEAGAYCRGTGSAAQHPVLYLILSLYFNAAFRLNTVVEEEFRSCTVSNSSHTTSGEVGILLLYAPVYPLTLMAPILFNVLKASSFLVSQPAGQAGCKQYFSVQDSGALC